MCLFTIPATCRSLGMWFHIKLWFGMEVDRKSTRLNSSHTVISYAVFCLKKKRPLRPRGQGQSMQPRAGSQPWGAGPPQHARARARDDVEEAAQPGERGGPKDPTATPAAA